MVEQVVPALPGSGNGGQGDHGEDDGADGGHRFPADEGRADGPRDGHDGRSCVHSADVDHDGPARSHLQGPVARYPVRAPEERVEELSVTARDGHEERPAGSDQVRTRARRVRQRREQQRHVPRHRGDEEQPAVGARPLEYLVWPPVARCHRLLGGRRAGRPVGRCCVGLLHDSPFHRSVQVGTARGHAPCRGVPRTGY